jgi:CysZ protein
MARRAEICRVTADLKPQSLPLNMQFLRNMAIGLRAYYKALRFISEHRYYWFIVIPAILMLGIYGIGASISAHKPATAAENMNDIIWYMLRLLLEISVALLLMRFAKYLVVILLSPLLSHISQKVEFRLTGNEYSFSLPQLAADVRRGIRIAVRNAMWEYFFFLLVFLIASIGWKNASESPLFYVVFVIGFYYYGFSFIDYVNERLRLTVDESVLFVRRNRGLTMAIGCIYSIMIWVPVELSALFDWSSMSADPVHFFARFLLNLVLWLCAAFAPIWSIVAATIAMNDIVDLKANRYARAKE